MRLIGTLSFFDEDPDLIGMAIKRAIESGVDHLIAVDGPYDLYPNKSEFSSPDCVKAIMEETGRSVTLDLYAKKDWGAGNEVEKRNFMLGRALEIADAGDWLLVFDSDHLWHVNSDLKAALKSTDHDFAEVGFAEARDSKGDPVWYEARLLNRAIPGMRYEGAHWRIMLPDGTTSPTLRAGAADTDGPALDLRAMASVWHAVNELPPERRERQTLYYGRRDGRKIES